MKRILVVDDDLDTCSLLQRFLSKHGYEVDTAGTGLKAQELQAKKSYDLLISDFRLPDMQGLELLKHSKRSYRDTEVVIITGYSDIRMAVEVIKYGAADYITKPLYPEELLSLVNSTLKNGKEAHPGDADKKQSSSKRAKAPTPGSPAGKIKSASPAYIEGSSAASQRINEDIALVAPTPMSVIITGETGTGKEFVAQRIHELSTRARNPFVAIDCGALPKDIAGSEFFGHEKGAFTGAVAAKDGRFKQADGGTLFLDEIGNLSYEVQLKLLRVLQERKYTRVGGVKDIAVDVRVLAATNENLKQAVAEGRFREDLYYRLNEFAIDLRPLRERREEMGLFVSHFLKEANALLDRSVEEVSEEVMQHFRAYAWPGNLREMRNVIKRGVLLSRGKRMEAYSLPEELTREQGRAAYQAAAGEGGMSLKETAEVAERNKIARVLKETGNNKSKAARLLNIDRKTLYNKLKAYDL